LLCTEDDNSCYRNVCKMSVVSFALAVVFIIKGYFCRKYGFHTSNSVVDTGPKVLQQFR